MQKEEIFRVFDACQPTVAQVKEYLERISGVSPFDLIFKKDGKEYFSKKIAPDMGELVGVVVDKTVFYVKPLTFDDVKDLPMPIMAQTVFDFGEKIYAKAKPWDDAALNVLALHRNDLLLLSDMLVVFGYAPCFKQEKFLLLKRDSGKFGQYFNFSFVCDGETDIVHFLRFYGNIYFYASIQ